MRIATPPWSDTGEAPVMGMLSELVGRDITKAVEKQSFDGRYSADSIVVTLSVALALNNSIEMAMLIPITFKMWKGLYFWSLSICNLAVILYAVSFMMVYFDLGPLWLGKVLLDIGWFFMILCQSLVLYSRLGLILDNPTIIKAVKWMIIVTAVTVLPTVCVLDFGMTYSTPAFARGYFYIEHIQMTTITLQELIISGLYVWKTVELLKYMSGVNTRSMVRQLFIMSVMIIAMDILLVVLQYRHFQLYQEAIKGYVYSIKLRLELNILSKLVDLVHGDSAARSMTLEMVDSRAIAGQAQADVRQEFEDHGAHLRKKYPSTDKGVGQFNVHEGPVTPSRSDNSDSGVHDDTDRVMPMISRQRTAGRESDILYAEFMHDMK